MKLKTITKGLLAAATLAAAFILSPAAPAASAACDWRYDIWCIPDAPRLTRPRWPDPRPPLAARNSAWCSRQFIYGGTYKGVAWGWYLTDSNQIKKRLWPDYVRRTYSMIYWNGRAWLQPDSPSHQVVECDV